MIKRFVVGTTIKQTYVNSGNTPTSINASVLTGSETVISSGTPVSSGDGHYYRMVTVNSPGYYVSLWESTIAGKTYRKKDTFRVIVGDVD